MFENESVSQANFKILIADDDTAGSRRLADFLLEKGFSVDYISGGRTIRDHIKISRPNFIICDIALTDCNAIQLLTYLKESSFGDEKPKVLVTSKHNVVRNIKECIQLGASDYIVKPYKFVDILTRLVFHIQSKRDMQGAGKSKTGNQAEGADIYLQLLDLVLRECLSGRELDESLFNLTKMIALTLKAVRCSVVMISEDLQSGLVMASSDDRKAKGFKLDMNKYPEMLYVATSEKSVVIEDLEYDPMLAQIKNLIKGISFNSMIVCPVKRGKEIYGVISARMDRDHSKFNERDILFVQLVSQVASLLLSSNLNVPQKLVSSPVSNLVSSEVPPATSEVVITDTDNDGDSNASANEKAFMKSVLNPKGGGSGSSAA